MLVDLDGWKHASAIARAVAQDLESVSDIGADLNPEEKRPRGVRRIHLSDCMAIKPGLYADQCEIDESPTAHGISGDTSEDDAPTTRIAPAEPKYQRNPRSDGQRFLIVDHAGAVYHHRPVAYSLSRFAV